MKCSSKSLDVFDFKEEDDLSEMLDKFKKPNHIDQYKFVESAAKGTLDQSKEIGNLLCMNVDAITSYSALSTLPEAGHAFSSKSMARLDSSQQIISGSSVQQPQARLEKFEPGSLYPKPECCSGPGATSPGSNQLNCALLESPSSCQSIGGVSDADECMSERSVSTQSDMAEYEDSFDGPSSDNCFSGWEVGDKDVAVAFYPDYVVYRDIYCTDSVFRFSSGCVEGKGSTTCGDPATFNIQWRVDDIIDIESQWWGKFELAMVKIRVISGDAPHTEDVFGSSGIEELKFAVCDSDWYDKLEAVMSLDVKYKAIWNVRLETGLERSNDAACRQEGSLLPNCYFPNFDEPFKDVVYPKGDSDAVSISKRDVDLLQPETFVNDTIIDFYIKFLKNKILPEERRRFHFFNSFFFRKLADMDKDPSSALEGRAAFQRVRKWTRKLNLFEKDYIFIPVNFNYHWSLIVICHPGELANCPDDDIEKALRVPCMLHMDSIRGSHAGLKDLMQSYLCEEWKEKQTEIFDDISARFSNLRFISLKLPQQQNSFDCGLFLLHYVELFLEEAPENFSPFKITKFWKFLKVNWFPPAEASLKRVHIQRLIYDLLKNCSLEDSPAKDCSYVSPGIKYDNVAAVDFLSERCSPSKGPGSNFMSSQDVQGIEMTLLSTSSLSSSKHTNASGLVLKEFFEPGCDAEPFMDAQCHALDQTKHLHRIKSDMSAIEEGLEADEKIVYHPSTGTGSQKLAESTPRDTCAYHCSSVDSKAEACRDSGNPLYQAEHQGVVSSPETLRCASIDLLEVNSNFDAVAEDLSSGDKIDERTYEGLESTPLELLDDAEYSRQPNQMLVSCASSSILASCPSNLPGFSRQEFIVQENGGVTHDDLQLIEDDSVLGLDEQHAAKRMRFTPPLDREGLTRSPAKDLQL